MRGRDKSGDSPQTRQRYVGWKNGRRPSDGLKPWLSLLSLHFLAKTGVFLVAVNRQLRRSGILGRPLNQFRLDANPVGETEFLMCAALASCRIEDLERATGRDQQSRGPVGSRQSPGPKR